MSGPRDDARPTSRGALLLAAVVSVVVGSLVPFGDLLLYPFTLLATWVHEMGHGLTALALGGELDKLEIFADASGLAYTRIAGDVRSALVSLGGLVAPSVVGGAILATSRGPRRAQIVITGLAVALVVSLALWVRSFAGFVAVPVLAATIAVFVRWGSPRQRMFFAQFLGLRLTLDTLGRGMHYIFTGSATVSGVKHASDIAAIAESLGGPRLLWSVIVAAFCVVCAGGGLLLAWRGSSRRAAPGSRAHARP